MSFEIGKDCVIDPTATINVMEGRLGDRSIVNEGAIIEGRYVEIGNEAFIHRRAWIGGGSCHDPQSKLVAGDFLHMGVDSHINTAKEVTIGHECGLGFRTMVLTHGAYESALEGFPVQFDSIRIGDNVWLPNAWVNPGVKIGSNVVVAAGSVVNKDLPDGCLAGGVPVKVLKENAYPRKLSLDEIQLSLTGILYQALRIAGRNYLPRTMVEAGRITIIDGDTRTVFDTSQPRRITGDVTEFTEILKNQLRRNGIRFRYHAVFTSHGQEYKAWTEIF